MPDRTQAQEPLTSLDKLPDSTEAHVWADYIELLCLVNPDQTLSIADLKDRIRERRDVGEGTAEPDDIHDLGESEKEDRRTRRAADWYRHLRFRMGLFGDWYPFNVSPAADELSVVNPFGPRQRLYVFLLLASNLRYIRRHTNNLTTCFEILSATVLRKMLPDGAEVYHFGPRHQEGRYSGTLWNKIRQLADDLAEVFVAREEEFPPQNTGDGGLDLVAWVPMGDQLSTRLLVFGQCACTSEWVIKQHSSGPAVWINRIRFQAPPSNFVFIPISFRSTDGRWHKSDDIHQTVLLDRYRLLSTLGEPVDLPMCEDIVTDVLQQREGIV